jgi:hypothetical protein
MYFTFSHYISYTPFNIHIMLMCLASLETTVKSDISQEIRDIGPRAHMLNRIGILASELIEGAPSSQNTEDECSSRSNSLFHLKLPRLVLKYLQNPIYILRQ